MKRFEYYSFWLWIVPHFEETGEWLNQEDWQPRIIDYQLIIRYRSHAVGGQAGFSSIEEARTFGEKQVDAILDSL